MTIFEEYDVHSKFDLEKHKKRFTHYLEVVILEDGTIEYCVPSHQLKLIDIYEKKFNVTREQIGQLIPNEMCLDVVEWLCLQTHCVSVWENFHMGVCNRAQSEALVMLQKAGLYLGEIRTTPRWFFDGERWRYIDPSIQKDWVVFGFKGPYYFLSNFYPSKITYKGISYRNAEAAFHAQKDPYRDHEFSNLDASQAKRLGRSVNLRNDWEQVKYQIMYEIVYLKFYQNPDLKEALLNTGDMILVEANNWKDRYWGYDEIENIGLNHLGLILMKVRNDISIMEGSK